MLLIDDLLALPFRGLLGILRKIHETADRELNDEAYLQQKLMELQLLYEMDEIGEEEYSRQAAEWEARLNAVLQADDDAGFESGAEGPGLGAIGGGEGVTEKPHAA
ncbi:MAG: gas vesicle protein GvpG [Nitrospirae bacterium]|nr:gas vesicle protein GvpG [Nitrospirota bacterium]